jgi:hypothetical protein
MVELTYGRVGTKQGVKVYILRISSRKAARVRVLEGKNRRGGKLTESTGSEVSILGTRDCPIAVFIDVVDSKFGKRLMKQGFESRVSLKRTVPWRRQSAAVRGYEYPGAIFLYSGLFSGDAKFQNFNNSRYFDVTDFGGLLSAHGDYRSISTKSLLTSRQSVRLKLNRSEPGRGYVYNRKVKCKRKRLRAYLRELLYSPLPLE